MEGIKEQKNYYKNRNEIIQAKISSLEEKIKIVDQQLEPLYETWEKLMLNINVVKGSVRLLRKEDEIGKEKLRIKQIEEERDKNPDVIKMNLLRQKINELHDEVSKLRREQYENSLNELKSQISQLSDKAYEELGRLTKEHIDPLMAHGMTYEVAKRELGPTKKYLIDNLEEKINIFEKILNDIEESLADKYIVHNIEKLRNQLKATEHF